MDSIPVKPTKKQSNVITVYLRENEMEIINKLKSRNANISKICRQAIRDAGKILENRESSMSVENQIREDLEDCISRLNNIKVRV
jgi:hypothetical protein